MRNSEIASMNLRARKLRKDVLNFSLETGIGHFGGSFSEIEILISLYDVVMRPEDKFILSKGHACNPWYILLREKGYEPKISGHPDIDLKNGICCTTGSLGHGLPIGVGMAFAKKIKKQNGRVYVLMGDGECQEGTTWESIPLATKYNLDNLITIVDHNRLQSLEETKNVSPMDLKEIFTAFGCYVTEVDGHSFKELIPTLNEKKYDKPHVIIANTIKGKGVSYMENDPKWHGRRPTLERIKPALEELK